jgi:hypothetical protein
MNQLPQTQNPIVLRTDFSNQSAWEKALNAILKPYGDYRVGVEFVEKMEYKDITKEQLLKLIPENYNHSFIIIFDRLTATMSESPLLIVDLFEEPGREFRADPSQIFGIESNLAIANMDFSEFANFVDEDGIYCGYPLQAEDIDPQMDKATIASILASLPVNRPPKTLDIRQHIRYWITRIFLNSYRKRLQE